MIIKYKSFENLLKDAPNWKSQHFIDIENHYKENEIKQAKKIFSNHSLIAIDPTDKSRNVAAVLSKEKYSKFIYFARKLLENPELAYFIQKDVVMTKTGKEKIISGMQKNNQKMVIVLFKKPKVIDDILYPQLRKFMEHLVHVLNVNDFKVERSFEFANPITEEAGVAIELLSDAVPGIKVIYGPSVFNPKAHQDIFIKKHKNFWFENERFRAEISREFTSAYDLLKKILSQKEAQLRNYGVPSYIAPVISKKFDVVSLEKISKIKTIDFWKNLSPSMIK